MLNSIYHDTEIAVEEIQIADNATLTGAGVDMKGYEGVAFIVAIQNYEEGQYVIKAQQSTSSAFDDAADLAGSAQTFSSTGGNDTLKVIDVNKPLERYVRPIVTVPNLTATTQAVSVISIRYGGRIRPESNSGEFLAAPAEGTA